MNCLLVINGLKEICALSSVWSWENSWPRRLSLSYRMIPRSRLMTRPPTGSSTSSRKTVHESPSQTYSPSSLTESTVYVLKP